MWFVNLMKVLLLFIFGMSCLWAGFTVLIYWSLNHGSF